MSTQRDHVDPLLEEIPVTSSGEEVDPKVLDLAMKIAEKMFLKMKEEDAKKKVEEEESRRKAEADKGKGRIEYNDDLVELLVSKVMSKVSLNTEGSSIKSKGNDFNKVQFNYSRNFIPNFSFAPLGKLPTHSELNYDEWADKMKSHLIGVHPSLWEIVNIGMYKPAQGEDMTPEMMQEVHRNAQRSASPKKERNRVLFMSSGAPDCPVCQWTEGKNRLPNGDSTAHNCLGAIKGTPRSMEQTSTPPLNILRCLDTASTHLDHCD
jgi:hypothetical protein